MVWRAGSLRCVRLTLFGPSDGTSGQTQLCQSWRAVPPLPPSQSVLNEGSADKDRVSTTLLTKNERISHAAVSYDVFKPKARSIIDMSCCATKTAYQFVQLLFKLPREVVPVSIT